VGKGDAPGSSEPFTSTFEEFGFTIAPTPSQPKQKVTHQICHFDNSGKAVCP